MTLCAADWYFWEVNTLLAPCHPLPKTKIPLHREKCVNYCAFSVCRREERQKKHDEIRKKYGKVQFISFLNATKLNTCLSILTVYSLIIALTVLFTCVLNGTHFFLALSSTSEQFYHYFVVKKLSSTFNMPWQVSQSNQKWGITL